MSNSLYTAMDGGVQIVTQPAAELQTVYLDFDGEATRYNGEIAQFDVNVSDSGLTSAQIAEVVAAFKPDVMALEQLYSLYERPETAILMGHARGAIMLAAAQTGIPVVSYAATKIKKTTTGNGRAPKAQMQRAVQLELRLPRLPEPPDVADAIAVAFCHFTEARLTQRSSVANPICALLAEPPKRPTSPIWPQIDAR